MVSDQDVQPNLMTKIHRIY